jgi:hypothetical protein
MPTIRSGDANLRRDRSAFEILKATLEKGVTDGLDY